MPLKVGTAYLDIQAKLDSLRTQLRGQVQQQVKGAGADAAKGFSNSFKQAFSQLKGGKGLGGLAGLGDIFGKAAIGAAGLGAVVAGIKNVADETAAFAAQIDDLQDVTGASAEDASRLKAVFDAVGLSATSAGRPILRLSESIRKGGEGLKDFFSTADISRLQNQDLSKTIFDLADRYKQLNTAQEQNQLLVAAFGARGLGMREVLERETKDLQAYIETAEKTGRIFDEEAIENARRYQVAIRELGLTFDGLKFQVGKAAIPAITNFTNNVRDEVGRVQGAAEGLGGVLGRIPEPIRNVGRGLLSAVPGLGLWFAESKRATEATDDFSGSLDELAISAADNEDAAERLGAVYKSAFAIASQAAADFEKRLDALSPALGEPFKDVEFGIADRFDVDAEAIEAAQERVEDASERLSDTWDKFSSGQGFDKGKWQPSEGIFTLEELRKSQEQFAKDELEREADFMSEHAGDLDDAAKDYKRAVGDLADAKEELQKAQKGTLIEGFSTVLAENTADLELFADSLEKLKTRFQKLGGEGVGEFEEAFLAGLADLGPGAASLLKNVANLSDKELSGLKDKFAAQVKAAKKAADIEFDKYPRNFAEKMGAARDAAIREGEGLVERFNMLEGNLTLQEAMADEITGIAQVMEATLGPTLNEQQIEFLTVARTADTAAERIDALQKFINSLTSKTVDIQANVTTTFAERGVPPEGMDASAGFFDGQGYWHPFSSLEGRAGGGSVKAGYPYWVGEQGREIFVPETNGRVASHSQSMTASDGGAMTIVVPVSIDGREVARVTAPYNSRAMDHRRRARV